jgi:molybdopterin molybdotransferase
MISADEALALVLEHARAHASAPIVLDAGSALGLTLEEPLVADRDYPPFDRSVMDGFAVRIAHAGRTVPIRGESRPGVAGAPSPDDDGCIEIMTGAPCPLGTEAVVMKEEVRKEAGVATFPPGISRGQNIVSRGSERRSGEVVLPKGAVITPITVALLATLGQLTVRARPLPTVALLVTGDEVVAAGPLPTDVEIRDSNGPMLEAMARAIGVTRVGRQSVRDTPVALGAALEAASFADVVVLTGGVSAGNYDLVPAALVSHGATVVFHKVRQQPGKPILFATKGARMFFGLPGTPLGCHLGFHRYVGSALRSMAGKALRAEERGQIALAWSTKSPRRQFVLAKVVRRDAAWSVTPVVPMGSSDLFTAWEANATMNVPEGTRELPVGAEVTFEWLDGAS